MVLHGLLANKFGADSLHINNYSSGGLVSYYTAGEPAAAGAEVLAVIAEIKAIAAGTAEVEATKTKVCPCSPVLLGKVKTDLRTSHTRCL